MKRKRVEILAPAGTVESMKAAVAAGADAVYMGGSRFGARAYAGNPDEAALLEAIDYAHLHGRRLYLTVNTLMKNEELKELEAFLMPYYLGGLDAVIVQDLGVLSLVRERFPDLPVHASTQMTVTGPYGARLLKELGVKRVVPARELSLLELAGIRQEADVELESFVHGALCYSYSGQCLFSSLIGGRSGNRGRCAQTCRLPYDVMEDGKALNERDGRYVLSLKDLCTLDFIPDMIQAGIYSMKIEGRMKSPRYTAGVTDIYRKYVDLYLDRGKEVYCVEERDRKRLQELFDRGGQTDGYYRRHNGKDMVVWKEKPGFREGNQELFDYLDCNFLEKEVKESISGSIRLEKEKPASLTVSCENIEATVLGDVVLAAVKQPLDEGKIKKQLEKTGNTPFYFETLSVECLGSSFLPVQSLNDLRRRGLKALEEALTGRFHRRFTPAEREEAPVGIAKTISVGKPQRPPIHVLLERPDCLFIALKEAHVKRIYVDTGEFGPKGWKAAVTACHAAGKECMAAMPYIFRTEARRYFDDGHEAFEEAGFDGILIRSLEEVGYWKASEPKLSWIFDYDMYGMNRLGEDFLTGLGATGLTWPVELNRRELSGLSRPGELIIYGRIPMMVTAQCLQKDLAASNHLKVLTLKDRMGKEFPVKNHCVFCYNTIYNSAPISLLGLEEEVEKLFPSAVRLQFTIETPEETKLTLQRFIDGLVFKKRVEQPFKDFTRGHFKRGVE